MLFSRKNIRFLASLLVLGTLSTFTRSTADPLALSNSDRLHRMSTLAMAQAGGLARSTRSQAIVAYRMLSTHKRKIMIVAGAGLGLYATRTAWRVLRLINKTLDDLGGFLNSDADELPQSLRQALKMVYSLLNVTRNNEAGNTQPGNQSQTIPQILEFLATPQGQALAERLTGASIGTIMPLYFAYSYKLLQEGRTSPSTIKQIVDSALATQERRDMVERTVVQTVPAMISQLQMTLSLLRERRIAQAAARGEAYVEETEYSFEKLFQAADCAPRLTSLIVRTAVESAMRGDRTQPQEPAAPSLLWTVIRYPGAILSGVARGTLQYAGIMAPATQTEGQHVTQ